tara:strand:- start:1115 stop:1915 length:801 start_codon:yes stop_codon:yes gene_type:complete
MDENEFQKIRSLIEDFLKKEDLDNNSKLNECLRYLAKHRSARIANTIIQREGRKILYGPFKGMNFLDNVSEGCFVPKLLGIYESELHDYINHIVLNKPDIIINVGSAEGYYAVGLKKLLPDTDVFAFDTDINAQEKCKELSIMNKVNINIEGEFSSEILNNFKNKKVVLMCDIEGDESNLITEENIDMYSEIEVCIELHYNNKGKHNVSFMPEIFQKSHKTELVVQKGKSFIVPEFIANLSHLDILLSAWEYRSYPTPWLIAKPLQ